MYCGTETPYRIVANIRFGGAVLSMLVADLSTAAGDVGHARSVALGSAIPRRWVGSSLDGLRLRGDRVVDFEK
jgi:hypothetical protein